MPFIKFIPHPTEVCERTCIHPEHDPPKNIVLKPGIHIWECPACGETHQFIVTGCYSAQYS